MTAKLRFAVLGDPVAHSKSPVMHAAAYRALHLPHTYEAIRAEPSDLPRLVRALREGEYEGFNVTVPHKRRILELVDAVAPSAASVGAANTLVRAPEGRIVAHNTDVPALANEIARLAPERASWEGARALVIGTGGAARSAVIALLDHLHVAEVIVRGRRAEAGDDDALGRRVTREPLAASPARDASIDVVVQATSAGMQGADPGDGVAAAVAWSSLPPRAVALDVVYAPPETPFLRAAVASGVRAANGMGMLAGQGALAFELWLGLPAPYNAMLAAIL